MKRVLIIGAGALGQQFHHYITNYSSDKVIGWVDDSKKKGSTVLNLPVLGGLNDLKIIDPNIYDYLAVGIGYKHLHAKNQLIKKLLKQNYALYSFIHPSAYIDKTAKLKKGVFIYPNAVVDQRVTISEGSILNNNVVVSHDSNIGLCSFIAPSVTISGDVQIGDNCFIGAGTIIKDGILITDTVSTGAGTLVLNNIDESGVYVGGPKLRKLYENSI